MMETTEPGSDHPSRMNKNTAEGENPGDRATKIHCFTLVNRTCQNGMSMLGAACLEGNNRKPSPFPALQKKGEPLQCCYRQHDFPLVRFSWLSFQLCWIRKETLSTCSESQKGQQVEVISVISPTNQNLKVSDQKLPEPFRNHSPEPLDRSGAYPGKNPKRSFAVKHRNQNEATKKPPES